MKTSVIVPIYNDPEGLETTVRSLLDQSATDYEVIIADNGSTDGTTDIAREFAEDERVRHVIENDVQSSYAARNAGIETANGDVLGFVDADMWVAADYVDSITDAMETHDRRYMGCNVELVVTGGVIARYRRASGFPIEKYVTQNRFAPTCCLVVHRDLFDTVGTFDSRLVSNGDLEFGRRVSEAGFDLAYEPGITVYHPTRSTIRQLIGQSRRIGRGHGQIQYYHGDRIDMRESHDPRNYLPVDPLAFYSEIGDETEHERDLVCWYVVACLQKWSRTIGHVEQTVHNVKRS